MRDEMCKRMDERANRAPVDVKALMCLDIENPAEFERPTEN